MRMAEVELVLPSTAPPQIATAEIRSWMGTIASSLPKLPNPREKCFWRDQIASSRSANAFDAIRPHEFVDSRFDFLRSKESAKRF